MISERDFGWLSFQTFNTKITHWVSKDQNSIMMMMMIEIMQPPFNISSLCGRHFVYNISFHFLNRCYKSGNCGLTRLNNLTDVTQLLSNRSGIRTESGESSYHDVSPNDDHLWGTRFILRRSKPLSAYWLRNWGRLVLVIPPNNKESQSQYQNTRAQTPFLSDNMLTTNNTWEFQWLCWCFRRNVHCCHHSRKDVPRTKSKWCEFAVVDIFSFCVLLTDWHLLSC